MNKIHQNISYLFYRNKNLCLIVFFLISINLVDAQNSFKESPNNIGYSGKNYIVQITKDPFQLTISNGKGEVAKLEGIISEDSTVTSKSQGVIRWFAVGGKIKLIIAASNKGFYSADFEFDDNALQYTILPSDRKVIKKIGIHLNTEVSGHWYGGSVVKGHLWPLELNDIEVDPFYATSNQTSPIWYTSKGMGLIVQTYQNMGYSFNKPDKGIFELYSKKTNEFKGTLVICDNIRMAYHAISEIIGKPTNVPLLGFFKYPQFNTWIEFLTKVNQEGIEKYTKEIHANNFPSNIFIIDDKWTKTYGDLDFDPDKFPDPSKMIEEMHKNGLKVALWVTPFIEKAAANYTYATERKFLIMNVNDNSPYIARWWNGQAAIVDLSNPEAYNWFLSILRNLQKKYGVDGFKLDAGDASFLMKPFKSYGNILPNEYSDLFVSLGTHFEVNELKIGWFAQSMGLIQRLRDKSPNWNEADGIKSIIPHAMTASLIGYCFLCPDMIGGGLDQGFISKDYKFDEELFVRWTEASALMPMMQYSLAPWKLSKENIAICKKYSELHVSLGDYIYSLAQQSKINGNPIIRPLFFEYPEDEKCYLISDQFILGNRFLVAPVLIKGALSRKVYLPEGTWVDFWTSKVIPGGQTIEYPATLDVLPIFIKVE